MARENFNMSLHDAEKWEESRRLCMLDQETIKPSTLQQRPCEYEKEFLKEKAEKEYFRNRYLQLQAELLKLNSKCKDCIDCEESSIAFENLSSGGNCRGLKKELCREMSATEHSKKRYLHSQAGLLRVQSLWENFKKKLEGKITELQNKSSSGSETNTDLKREITKLSLVLDELFVQAEVSQREDNQPQNFLKQICMSPVELEHNEDRRYAFSDPRFEDQDVPKVQKPGVCFEINSPGSKLEEISAGKTKKPIGTHCITAHTKVRVLSVQERFGSTLEGKAQDCELEQMIVVGQRHDSEHSMESRKLDVAEGTKQAFFLLQRHCDHKMSLFKETGKKEYYKRQYLRSQFELFKLYLKRMYFNNRSEENITKIENVSSVCINLQREMFKVKSEKEHYINQCLQFQAGLLRVNSMWKNLKTQLENKMSELQTVNSSGSDDNLDLGMEIDGLSLALDELLVQLEASEQNCNQAQSLLKPNKKTAKWTFSAEVEQTKHRRYTFVDCEDEQCDVPKVQDLIASLKNKAPESTQEEAFAATTEELKDTHCKSIETKSEELALLKAKIFSLSLDLKAAECEQEQISTLDSVFFKERQDPEQDKESARLYAPEAELAKLFSLQKRVCDLEAELSKGNDEKDYYKKLYDKSQAELLETRAILDKFNPKSEEKTAVPLNASSSGNDGNDDVDENIKDLHKAADAFEFQAQRIEELAEKFKKFAEPKETDPKDTFFPEVKHEENTCYTFLDAESEHPVVPRHDTEQNKESESVCTPEAEITKLFSLQQRVCDLEAELLSEKDKKDYYKKLHYESQAELLGLHATLDNLNQKSEEKTAVPLNASSSGNDGKDDVDENIKDLRKTADAFEFQAQRIEELAEKLKKFAEPKETGLKDTYSEEVDQNEHRFHTFLDAEHEVSDVLKEQEPDVSSAAGSEQEEASSATTLVLKGTHCIFNDTKSEELVWSKMEKFSTSLDVKGPEFEQEKVFALKVDPIEQRHDTQQSRKSQLMCVPDEVTIKPLLEPQRYSDLEAELSHEKSKKDYYKKLYNESQAELLELRAMLNNFNQKSEEKTAVPLNASSSGNDGNDDVAENIKDLRKAADAFEFQAQRIEELAEKLKKFAEPKETGPKDTFSSEVKHEEHTCYTFLDAESEHPVAPNLQNPSVSVEIHAPQGLQQDTSAATNEEHRDTYCIGIDTKSEEPEKTSTSVDIKAPEFEQEQITALDSVLKERQDTEQSKESQSVCTPEAEITKLFSLQQRVCDLEAELLNEKDEKDYYKKLLDILQVEVLELHTIVDNINQKSEEKTSVPLNVGSSGNDSSDDVDEYIKGFHEAAEEFKCQAQRIEELAEKLKKFAEPKETDLKDTFSCEVKHEENTCYMFLDAENEHPVVPTDDTEQSKDSRSVCTPEAEKTKLFSLQQRNCDLEAELLNEKGEKDYYKKLYDKSQAELLELCARLDNLNQTSEEKTAVPLNASSCGNVSVEIHAPQRLQQDTSAATNEEHRDIYCIDTKSEEPEKTSTSVDIKAPEFEQEQITALDSVLKERQDTEQSKESQSVCTPEAEITKLFSLQQRVCDLEAELSKGNDEKDYYKKLYNESQAELLETRAILDKFNQQSEEKTAVPLNVSPSGNDGNDDVDENIKDLRKAADAFEFQAQRIEELAEKLKEFAESKETDPKDTFSSDIDHNEQRFHTFLDAEHENRDVPNVQNPSGSMEITGPESVPDETSAATHKELKETHCIFMDTKSEEFVLPEAEKSSTPLDIEVPEYKQEQISASDADLLQQRHDTKESKESQSSCVPEAEIPKLSLEQQTVCDLEVKVLQEKDVKDYSKEVYNESEAEHLKLCSKSDTLNIMFEGKTNLPENACSSGNNNADVKCLHLASEALQFQVEMSEQSDTKPNQTMPEETTPVATLEVGSVDFLHSNYSAEDEEHNIGHHMFLSAKSEDLTEPGKYFQMSAEETSVVEDKTHQQRENLFFNTKTDTCELQRDSSSLTLLSSESDQGETTEADQNKQRYTSVLDTTTEHLNVPQQKKDPFEVTSSESEQGEVLIPVREQNHETFFDTDSQETASELDSTNAAVETVIPEEEPASIETENREIRCPPIFDTQSDHLIALEQPKESSSLDIEFTESDEDIDFPALEEPPEQNYDTFFELGTRNTTPESNASSEVIQLDVQTQTEAVDVCVKETFASEGQSSRFWHFSLKVLRNICLPFGFCILGAYINQTMNHNVDLTYGLYHLLEPFCNFEHVSPFPF